ncbi:TPA: GHKL domain-containing protein [Enterococcus faecalis]
MVDIDTKAYIFRMSVIILFYYVTFFSIYRAGTKCKRLILFLLFFPCTFVASVFIAFADVIPVFSSYLFLKRRYESDYIILSFAILSMLINYASAIFSSLIILYFTSYNGTKGFLFVCIELIVYGIILLTLIFLYRYFNLNLLVEKYNSGVLTLLLCYLFFAVLIISYAAHYYKAFDMFVIGLATFLIIQTVFIIIIFIYASARQKEKYEKKFEHQKLENLKRYTDQLEQNQENLTKFRHDYKNLLLSLKEVIAESGELEAFEHIKGLEEYSSHFFSATNLNFRYCKNIENPYLKSLIIAKLFETSEQNIECVFECRVPIKNIPISIFDYIRLVGIALDNAIEAAKESKDPKVSIMLYHDIDQTEFFIENSCIDSDASIEDLLERGYSTKQQHEGIGLSNIQEIKRKNPNVLVQYNKSQAKFSVQIIVIGD